MLGWIRAPTGTFYAWSARPPTSNPRENTEIVVRRAAVDRWREHVPRSNPILWVSPFVTFAPRTNAPSQDLLDWTAANEAATLGVLEDAVGGDPANGEDDATGKAKRLSPPMPAGAWAVTMSNTPPTVPFLPRGVSESSGRGDKSIPLHSLMPLARCVAGWASGAHADDSIEPFAPFFDARAGSGVSGVVPNLDATDNLLPEEERCPGTGVQSPALRVKHALVAGSFAVSFYQPTLQNYPIQGLGGEVVQTMTGRLFRRFLTDPDIRRAARLVNTVHDCVWVDISDRLATPHVARAVVEELSAVREEYHQRYMGSADWDCGFGVSVEAGPTMYDLHSYAVPEVEGVSPAV
eukprot:TRINITY_DN5202_c0_g1_i1.p1 TRINITY_DN5202_c0_g1~~TRINITY_DN5202_c0_g1_i1.p1  ORF type:complete len:350 (+),score=74.19 TRINITY_DN5202_c0_g1_i1:10-1059(+)